MTVFPTNAHQPPDALLVHPMAFVLQVPSHMSDTIEGGIQKLPINNLRQAEVLLRLTGRL